MKLVQDLGRFYRSSKKFGHFKSNPLKNRIMYYSYLDLCLVPANNKFLVTWMYEYMISYLGKDKNWHHFQIELSKRAITWRSWHFRLFRNFSWDIMLRKHHNIKISWDIMLSQRKKNKYPVILLISWSIFKKTTRMGIIQWEQNSFTLTTGLKLANQGNREGCHGKWPEWARYLPRILITQVQSLALYIVPWTLIAWSLGTDEYGPKTKKNNSITF